MKILPKIILITACLSLSWSRVSCADLKPVDLRQAGLAAINASDYDLAAVEIKRAIKLAEMAKDPSLTGDLYYRLATIQKHVDGERSLLNAIKEHLLVANGINLALADDYTYLGNIKSGFKKHSEAEDYWKKGLALKLKIPGIDEVQLLPNLHNLGSLFQDEGRFAEAAEMYEQYMRISRETGFDSINNVYTLSDLASVYCDLGDLIKAKKTISLAEKRLSLGDTNEYKQIAVDFCRGKLYAKSNQIAKADMYFRRALLASEKNEPSDYVPLLLECTRFYRKNHNSQKSRECLLKAQKLVLTKNHAKYLESVKKFSSAYPT